MATIISNITGGSGTTTSLYAGYRTSDTQTFTTTYPITLSSIELAISKVGSPTGNAYIKIYDYTGANGTNAVPTGSALITSNAKSVSTLTASDGYGPVPWDWNSGVVEKAIFTFNNEFLLAGTYVFSVEYDSGDSSNRISLTGSTSSIYSGNAAYYDVATTSWVTAETWALKDFYFILSGQQAGVYLGATASLSPKTPPIYIDGYYLSENIAPAGISTTSAYGVNWKGQTFTVGTTNGTSNNINLGKVNIRLKRVGSPGNVTVSLRATSGESPTGSDLSSITVDGNAFSTSSTDVDFIFTDNIQLTSGTKYAIIIRAPSGDASNYISISYSNSNPYSGGYYQSSTNSGSSWSASSSADFRIKVYGVLTNIQTPSAQRISYRTQTSIEDLTNGNEVIDENDTLTITPTSLVYSSADPPEETEAYFFLTRTIKGDYTHRFEFTVSDDDNESIWGRQIYGNSEVYLWLEKDGTILTFLINANGSTEIEIDLDTKYYVTLEKNYTLMKVTLRTGSHTGPVHSYHIVECYEADPPEEDTGISILNMDIPE
jgi:hypothetical protein